jgi:hypothetical protein
MRPSAALLALALASCAAIERDVRERMCNPDAGFQEGVNDGRAGRDMDQGFTDSCDPATAPAVRAAYRGGYLAGATLAARVQPPVVVVQGVDPAAAPWLCEVRTSGVAYRGGGASEAEAGAVARARCNAVEHEMWCRDVTCRRNE